MESTLLSLTARYQNAASRRVSGHAAATERHSAFCDRGQHGPNGLVFIRANPQFAADSPGPANVAIASKEDGRFDNGKWFRVRRLNGDEAGDGLPEVRNGSLKINPIRFD